MAVRSQHLIQPNSNRLKTGAAVVGGVAFLMAGVIVGWCVRHYQMTGQPMPNGKGDFMTFPDGYYIAAMLVLMSIAWFVAAHRFRTASSMKGAH